MTAPTALQTAGPGVESPSLTIVPGTAEGPIIATGEALSFWGGVDPATSRVIDVHHPLHGVALAGGILLMPGSRGSCSGSGVLLDMALNGRAPAALVFSEAEDVLTLGALVAAEMFGRGLPVLRLAPDAFAFLARAGTARIVDGAIIAAGSRIPLAPARAGQLELTNMDRALLAGQHGPAAQQAMRIILAMGVQQGATGLVDVTQVHIDGCIYASPANLTFATRMAEAGGRVRVPTTTNAISVDLAGWRSQGVPPDFGAPAARLAEAYLRMGCAPSFTCAPYLLETAPRSGECIAWAESNAVIFANSVLGARTLKHPDFLDLCIALTGRAPCAGVYENAARRARRVVTVEWPDGADDAAWPLLGYLVGRISPDRIPLIRGLSRTHPSRDDLKALCAAFGTTSAAPMLHIDGVTPEAADAAAPDADAVRLTRHDLAAAWRSLHDGPAEIDLVAFGSPHASLEECRSVADALAARERHPDVMVIITAGRDVIRAARQDGTLARLLGQGVRLVPDLCWCSISEPVFPPHARTVMTNSGKYAHYGPGLSGRAVRLGALADCVEAATTGRVRPRPAPWA